MRLYLAEGANDLVYLECAADGCDEKEMIRVGTLMDGPTFVTHEHPDGVLYPMVAGLEAQAKMTKVEKRARDSDAVPAPS